MSIYDTYPRAGYRLDGMPKRSEHESTRLWLIEQDAVLNTVKVRLIAGYPRHDTPDHVESAIDLIERAQDQLARERSELDAIEGGK